MTTFAPLMQKIVNDYKLLIRKSMPTSQSSVKIKELGIKRKLLKAMNEAQLYKIGAIILKELEQNIHVGKCSSYYCGAEEFAEHLKKILNSYCVENNQVVNTAQKASYSMLEAIQLMALPEEKLNAATAIKLNQCVYNVTKYGDKEQLQILTEAIKTHKKNASSFFCKLWETFLASLNATAPIA